MRRRTFLRARACQRRFTSPGSHVGCTHELIRHRQNTLLAALRRVPKDSRGRRASMEDDRPAHLTEPTPPATPQRAAGQAEASSPTSPTRSCAASRPAKPRGAAQAPPSPSFGDRLRAWRHSIAMRASGCAVEIQAAAGHRYLPPWPHGVRRLPVTTGCPAPGPATPALATEA